MTGVRGAQIRAALLAYSFQDAHTDLQCRDATIELEGLLGEIVSLRAALERAEREKDDAFAAARQSAQDAVDYEARAERAEQERDEAVKRMLVMHTALELDERDGLWLANHRIDDEMLIRVATGIKERARAALSVEAAAGEETKP